MVHDNYNYKKALDTTESSDLRQHLPANLVPVVVDGNCRRGILELLLLSCASEAYSVIWLSQEQRDEQVNRSYGLLNLMETT
jgi:hypothetical protein